jgi:hypothetical protein
MFPYMYVCAYMYVFVYMYVKVDLSLVTNAKGINASSVCVCVLGRCSDLS